MLFLNLMRQIFFHSLWPFRSSSLGVVKIQMTTISSYLPQTGIDILLKDNAQIQYLKGKKVGILANQSSVTSEFVQSATALHDLLGPSLSCLFAPEHGWSAFCAAGEDIKNAQEPYTNLPVYSLYGPLFKKNLSVLENIDVLIIDLQDVGVRCYTYVSTCAKLMEYVSLNKLPIEFIVCDRPNPLGTHVNGPLFNPEMRSLVSYVDVPFQHGKTMGEVLKKHNSTLPHAVSLSTITGSSTFHPHKHVWVPPSPGLPDWEAVLLYPGLVLLEGTNISEGRGSSLPFKCAAAPNLDDKKVVTYLNEIPDSGIKARSFSFTPQSSKFKGQTCQGVQIHIVDHQKVDGLRSGIHLLHILIQTYPLFQWELFREKYFIDSLTGSPNLRLSLDRGDKPEEILASWETSRVS